MAFELNNEHFQKAGKYPQLGVKYISRIQPLSPALLPVCHQHTHIIMELNFRTPPHRSARPMLRN